MRTQPILAGQYANLAVVLGVVEQDHELARMWAQIPARVRVAKTRGAQEAAARITMPPYDGPLPADLPEPRLLHGCDQVVCEAVEFCRDCGRGHTLRMGQREREQKREAKRGVVRDVKAAAGGDDAE